MAKKDVLQAAVVLLALAAMTGCGTDDGCLSSLDQRLDVSLDEVGESEPANLEVTDDGYYEPFQAREMWWQAVDPATSVVSTEVAGTMTLTAVDTTMTLPGGKHPLQALTFQPNDRSAPVEFRTYGCA